MQNKLAPFLATIFVAFFLTLSACAQQTPLETTAIDTDIEAVASVVVAPTATTVPTPLAATATSLPTDIPPTAIPTDVPTEPPTQEPAGTEALTATATTADTTAAVVTVDDAEEASADATEAEAAPEAPAEPMVTVNRDEAQDGYLLIAPFFNKETLLLDAEGNMVQSWESTYLPGQTSYLLENGDLLRAGAITESVVFSDIIGFGGGGIIETYSWDGDLLWQYRFADDRYLQHHDIAPLPNGNVLLLVFELIPTETMLALGRKPELIPEDADGIWAEAFLELDPTTGDIVWEWHVIDHVVQDWNSELDTYGVISEHPELININYVGIEAITGVTSDWIHANALDYNPELDQIMMTTRHFSEIWIIDHSTTTAEAATSEGGAYGSGGNLLYRWGNPVAYGGDESLRTLWTPHDGRWVKEGVVGAGNITLFNNGNADEERLFSGLIEFAPTLDQVGAYVWTSAETQQAEIIWEWFAPDPEGFFSPFMSGVEKQANGNYLVNGSILGRVFEMSPTADLVWNYQYAFEPFPWIFRATRYVPEYPGLSQLDGE